MGLVCELGAEMDVIKHKSKWESTEQEAHIRCSTLFLLGIFLFYFFYSLCSFIHSIAFCEVDEWLKESQTKNAFPRHQA